MNDHQLLPVEGAYLYTADFTDMLPESVTITAVTWTSSAGLTLASQVDDFPNKRSTIKVSGAQHAMSYVLQAKATASNGEVYPKDIALIGFNG